ncbi:MAG: PEGA domain-containing protein [Patescibacteria group bacterium]
MTLFHRRLIYVFFIVVFLLAAPAVILYTQGYRYNLKKSRVQKTGIFIISSLPRRANIYLNGEPFPNTTPARLENILPGDYEVKLTKDGYHDWQKKLTVLENSTTFAEKIILWKNSQPVSLSSVSPSDWLTAPDQKKAAIINKNQLLFLDFSDGKLLPLADLSQYSTVSLEGWSNTSKKILVKTSPDQTGDYLVYTIEQKINKTPFKISGQKYRLMKWDLENDNLLYGLNEQGAWQIDLFSGQEKLLYADTGIRDFLFLDGQYYSFKDQKLNKVQPNGQNPEFLEEVRCDDCLFANRYFPKVILLDKKAQKTFIADPDQIDPLIKLDSGQIDWLKDGSLLLSNQWELWIYENKKNEPELITRLGQPIKQALWHPLGRHLIFTENNKIRIIELDNRELRNITDLIDLERLDYLASDSSGSNLYLAGTFNDQAGIFKINIK